MGVSLRSAEQFPAARVAQHHTPPTAASMACAALRAAPARRPPHFRSCLAPTNTNNNKCNLNGQPPTPSPCTTPTWPLDQRSVVSTGYYSTRIQTDGSVGAPVYQSHHACTGSPLPGPCTLHGTCTQPAFQKPGKRVFFQFPPMSLDFRKRGY